jgi:hypothetical protein
MRIMRTKAPTIPHKLNEGIFTKGSVLGLAMVWVVVSIFQWIWLRCDFWPPHGDGIVFILRGMDLATLIKANGIKALWDAIVVDHNGTFVSLVDLFYALYYVIFGIESEMELMTNMVFLGIGIVGVYGIGARLFNRKTGLIAALLFVSIPGVILFEKLGFREFQLMCFIASTCFLLLETENFTCRKYSILCGLSFGLALTIKYEAILSVCFPLFVAVLNGCFFNKNKNISRVRILINLMLFFGIALALPLVWYGLQWDRIYGEILSRITDKGVMAVRFSLINPFFYFTALFERVISNSTFIFIGLVFIYLVCARQGNKVRSAQIGSFVYLFLCFLIPFIAISFIKVQNTSHILPTLVFYSVFVAGVLDLVKRRIAQFVFILILALHIIVIHEEMLRPSYLLNGNLSLPMKISVIDRLSAYLGPRYGSVFGELGRNLEWPGHWDVFMKDVIRFIANDHAERSEDDKISRRAVVLVMVNKLPLRFFPFEYYNKKIGSPLVMQAMLYEQAIWNDDMSEEILFESGTDYLISEEFLGVDNADNANYQFAEDHGLVQTFKYINDHRATFNAHYKLVREFDTLRDSRLMIYRRQ